MGMAFRSGVRGVMHEGRRCWLALYAAMSWIRAPGGDSLDKKNPSKVGEDIAFCT